MSDSATPGQLLYARLGIDSRKIPLEKRQNYTAVKYFLTVEDEPPSDATNLEKVKRYLEALYHLCKLQVWEQMKIVIDEPIRLDTQSVSFSLPLYEYLMLKLLSRNLLEVSEDILISLQDTNIDLSQIIILKARALYSLDRLSESCVLFEQVRSYSWNNSEIYIEATGRLGMSQVQSELYEEGILNLNNALKMMDDYINYNHHWQRSLIYLALKADILSNIAYREMNKGNLEDAQKLYSEVIKICSKNGMFYKLVNPLVHQGVILRKKRYYSESLFYLEEAIKKSEEIGNGNTNAWISHHKAWVYLNQRKYHQAEVECLISLEGYKKIEDQRGITDSYEQLGFIFLEKGKVDDAARNFEIVLNRRKDTGKLQGAASCLMGLAVVSLRKGRLLKFIKTLIQGLMLYQKVGVLNHRRILRMLRLSYDLLPLWIGFRRKNRSQ